MVRIHAGEPTSFSQRFSWIFVNACGPALRPHISHRPHHFRVPPFSPVGNASAWGTASTIGVEFETQETTCGISAFSC